MYYIYYKLLQRILRKETIPVISKKRNFKLLRLIICLVVAVAASSMFLTIEPMASENANAEVPAAAQEDVVVEAQTFRAYSKGLPVTPLHVALPFMDATQTVDAAAVETALASLPEEEPKEEVEEETTESTYEEPVYEEDDEYYEEDSYEEDYEEDSDVYYEEPEVEESTPAQPEEEPEVEEEENEEGSLPEVSAPGTYSDLDYLAAICQIEAGYNYEGCLAVANVVLNRVNAGFGSSVYDVIYAPYQFATGWMEYYLQNGTSSTAREAAAAALAGSNNVGSYLYFNGMTWLDPETLDRPYVIIGGNVFY